MWNVLRWINSALNSAEWRLSLYNMLFGQWGLIVGGSIASASAIRATEMLRDYAPASWVVGGILTGIAIAIGYRVFISARERAQVLRFRARVADASHVNPLDDIFRRQRLKLTDLCAPIGGVVENKVFIECDIIGPANAVIFPDCTFIGSRGEGNDQLIIKRGVVASTGFAVVNCTFRNCRFFLVTFMVPEPFYLSFVSHNWTGVNWLTETPADKIMTTSLPDEPVPISTNSGATGDVPRQIPKP